MWETSLDGRPLRFHLHGINNQNFIMRDEATGSWWQQVSGEAVQGPLRGRHLELVEHEEVTFAVWKREHPRGRVLRPDEALLAAGRYASASWEEEMSTMPVVTPGVDTRLPPRTLIYGVEVGGESKAYPLAALREQSPIHDVLGGQPIVLVIGDDGKSVRAFERTIGARELEFFAPADTAEAWSLRDAETASRWDFAGTATSGPMTGAQLTSIWVLPDYWFDWWTYHPRTSVYDLGVR